MLARLTLRSVSAGFDAPSRGSFGPPRCGSPGAPAWAPAPGAGGSCSEPPRTFFPFRKNAPGRLDKCFSDSRSQNLRQINDSGHVCEVVSPAHTPRRAGDRIKTDRRDALVLARLSRAGELTAVWVPDAAHEAMRDLIRSREAASKDVRQARQRIQGFLLRYGRRYVGAVWKKRHRVWLGNQTFEHAAQQIAFQTYLNAMDQACERKVAIQGEIVALLPEWSLGTVVEALQALRGVAPVIAAGVVAEVGDMRRFDSPRQLMAYLGLVPGEHSSGETRRLTGITKAGSVVARRLIVEAAWAYRMPAKIGQAMYQRQEELSTEVRDIAWKAQVRLCARYRRMLARRKKAPVVITAIARELVGFIWAIAQIAPPRPAH